MFDQPLMILVWFALVLAAAAAWHVASPSRYSWAAIILVALSAIGMLVVERVVVTPREQIRIDLHQIARDLESNEFEMAVAGIDPQATEIRADVERAMRFGVIKKVSIKPNLKIQVTPGEPPHRARATFNAVATMQLSSGQPQIVPRFVVVELKRSGDRWLVRDYRLEAPMQ